MGALEELYEKIDALTKEVRSQRAELQKFIELNNEQNMTMAQVCQELDVTDNTIKKMIDSGDFPSAKKVGREWRFRRSEVMKLKA